MLIKIKDYELYLMEKEVAKSTIRGYLTNLKQLENFCLDQQASELSKELLIKFKQHLKQMEKYKVSTLNQKILYINIYLKWIKRQELTLKYFRQQSYSHRESVTKEEFRKMLAYSDDEMKLLLLTIANTGMRISEALSLKKKDLFKEMIDIENKKKRRTIGIPDFVVCELKNYMKATKSDERIFKQSQTTYRSRLKKIAEVAGVKSEVVYPHSFRHFFAKSFVREGGDVSVLQQMLGHSNITTTVIYTKMTRDELVQDFKKIHNN